MRRLLPLLLLLPFLLGAWTLPQPGQSWINGRWYCRVLSSQSYHCTQHWHRSAGQVISDNPAWVPNGPLSPTAAPAAPVSPSATFLSARNTYPWGQCTWGAKALTGENLNALGNARDWLANAQRRGLPTGSTPRVGATVVYQPGVQGASGLGHVAHVVALLSGGRFVVEEMNYYGYGGGFGHFSYRTSWTGWGVGFIY
jgi:surface antigen